MFIFEAHIDNVLQQYAVEWVGQSLTVEAWQSAASPVTVRTKYLYLFKLQYSNSPEKMAGSTYRNHM